jgi:hypothetical protein
LTGFGLRRALAAAIVSLGVFATPMLAASVSPALASVTVGQLADPNAGNCDAGVDFVQLGVTSGNSYVVPGNGTITAWTTQTGAESGALALKVFRKVGDPASFQAVGHSEPQRLTPGGTAGNTFPANVRVRQGDLLGVHTLTFSPCGFKDPGGQHAFLSGDLADAEVAGFGPESGFDLDVQAVFAPDNAFTLDTRRDKKKGTATLAINVPNAGELVLSGKDIRAASRSIPAAGETDLLVKAKGRAMRKLIKSGKAKVMPRITYTPTGGDPSTQLSVLVLKRRR